MGAAVVAGVESTVESESAAGCDPGASLHIRMLGSLAIVKNGRALALPPSRKLQALIAYLTLASHAQSREHLCELLWDIPNDPRGELRWYLSKARVLFEHADRHRIEAIRDTVRLDLTDCYVDALDISHAMQQSIDTIETEKLRALLLRFGGDFLEGLEIGRNPSFNSWLTTRRRRFRAYHAAVLEQLVARIPQDSEERFAYLESWLELAPFDQRVHELVLLALGHRGQVREGDEHLAAAARSFDAEGLDWSRLRAAWREAKAVPAVPSPGGEVILAPSMSEAAAPSESARSGAHRASIAVMPFTDRALQASVRGGPADGLAYDIITRLAKLRSLFVIAPGTVFALDQRNIGPEEAGRTLNVDYVVSGSLLIDATRISVNVELVEPRTARIVWADVFDHKLDDAFFALEEIGDQIVAAIEIEIESAERRLAILKPPSSLNAWEAHHRGLWHMYRFNRADNELAKDFFEMAIRLDPTFSRAYAGLSFTHWQNAFQRWGERETETEKAFETAGQGVIVDDRDPAAHLAMGRALWLRGSPEQSLVELQTSVDLSPNLALGHYALGFVNCQNGNAEAAIRSSDHSRRLSPFDPLLFGMLGVRAIALVRLGRFDEAADWAVKAATRPNAHVHIWAIAAHCLAVAGRLEEALGFLALIHKAQPAYGSNDFFSAFQLPQEVQGVFRDGAKRIGIE